jgi:2-oxoglutarate dehydrogenase E2 component (dihydrolipoamide succinyltransferase)
VAARILAEHGLSPQQIPSESVRLKRDDVLQYLKAAQTPPPAPAAPLSSMRRAIAEHMTRAHQTIPQGQTVMAADLTELVAWRESQKAEGAASVTFTVLFVSALARQLARLVEAPVDIGVAVALDQGLIVPVLRQADRLSLVETAGGIADLAARARSNRLEPDEVQGARMTVTNVGSFGNLTASPIVPLGQLGILGPGLVERRPMPTPDGGIRLGWRCLLALVFDRRAFDDLAADRFLRSVVDGLLSIPSL